MSAFPRVLLVSLNPGRQEMRVCGGTGRRHARFPLRTSARCTTRSSGGGDRRGGRNIAPDASRGLVYGYAVGLDMTRRDLQAEVRRLGRPWEFGKVFDQSCPIGTLMPMSRIDHPAAGAITLTVDGEVRQSGDLTRTGTARTGWGRCSPATGSSAHAPGLSPSRSPTGARGRERHAARPRHRRLARAGGRDGPPAAGEPATASPPAPGGRHRLPRIGCAGPRSTSPTARRPATGRCGRWRTGRARRRSR